MYRKDISRSMQTLLWIDKCDGEGHDLNPSSVKNTYLCHFNSAPLVQNHVTINSESDIKKGIGKAGSSIITFDNMPLFTELLNKFNNGQIIDQIKVFMIEISDTDNAKTEIALQYTFIDVIITGISAFFATKRIVVDGIDSNSSMVIEIAYQQYHVAQRTIDIKGEPIVIKVGTSNKHGYSKSK